MKYRLTFAVVDGGALAEWRFGSVRTKKGLIRRAKKLNLLHILYPDGSVILRKDLGDYLKYQEEWTRTCETSQNHVDVEDEEFVASDLVE